MAKSSRKHTREVAKAKKAKRDGIPIDAPDAPQEGSEAGDAGDLRRDYMVSRVRGYRAAANRHYQAAQRLAGQASPAAEQEARRAIDAAVRAFWWAEDTELEEAQHRLAHKIGKWTRQRFGCSIHFDGKSYSQRCSLDIAHKRMGFSAGYTCILICSICGGDISECPHMPDKAYWVRGGPSPAGYCPACMEEVCGHRVDRLYRVSVTKIVTKMRGREVSFVRRPASPEARLLAIPLSNESIAEKFGPEAFKPGASLSCDLCLGGCWGFEEFALDSAGGPVGRVVDAQLTDAGEVLTTVMMD